MIIATQKLEILSGPMTGRTYQAGERLDLEFNAEELRRWIGEAKAEDIPDDARGPARIAAIRAQANTDPLELPTFNLDSENIYEYKLNARDPRPLAHL